MINNRSTTNLKIAINSKLKHLAKGQKNFKLLDVNDHLEEVEDDDTHSILNIFTL